MMRLAPPFYLIACGGTGGHLFPGIAVAERLVNAGARVALVVSSKTVDQEAVKAVRHMEVWTLQSATGSHGSVMRFLGGLKGLVGSVRELRERMGGDKPLAVLGMGGFTSAAPVLCGKMRRSRVFLHEANAVPGRATRWLGRMADEVLLYFPEAVERLGGVRTRVVGMPVRSQFEAADAGACRISFGLDPDRPVLLVMGGSQGAKSINELVERALPGLQKRFATLQYLHLTGPTDFERMSAVYRKMGVRAVVRPFLTEMEWALGAAEVALSRAGGSSLAEFAAMSVPSILVPYPHASDDHQRANAEAFRRTGAALVLEAEGAGTEALERMLGSVLEDAETAHRMRAALGRWHQAGATEKVAELLLELADPAWKEKAALEASGVWGGEADGGAFELPSKRSSLGFGARKELR